MKKLYALAGVLLIAVMLSSIGFAAADVVWWPELMIPEQAQGLIWYFDTDLDDDGINEFSGRDVVRRSVMAIVSGADDGLDYEVNPLIILRTEDYVILFFLPRAFPELPLDENGLMYSTTWVRGVLKNGEGFEASGPGFTFRTK